MKRLFLFSILGLAPACAVPPKTSIITVFNAGSLAKPLRAVLDTFAAHNHLTIQQENAGSLETARKLTELGHIPDVVALADADIFPRLLIPRYIASYIPFARNRMVLAYSERSRFASEISADNWYTVLTRPGVEVGRSDPNLDPAGYRALLVFQLAELNYAKPGLAAALLRSALDRNVRPKSADLVALLQTGNLDYAWGYESVAKAAGLRFVPLPSRIDLGEPADSLFYAKASVRVTGGKRGDSSVVRGAPIVYGIAVPLQPPHGDVGRQFIAFLTSPAGEAILRAHQLDPIVSGQRAGE
jgi:molybdate/tungstate transport system substrate-binding protein